MKYPFHRFLSILLFGTLAAALPLSAELAPVKVFLLAGQSNMEGKAPDELLNYQAEAPKTREIFAHLRKNGKWIEREDVFIKYLDRSGPLTIGYGSPDRTGVELEFGTVMGNHFQEPVLLIKAAWGGHSLYKLFRSPSAGFPDSAVLEKELREARAEVEKENREHARNTPLPTMEDIKKEYGSSYRNMLREVDETRERLGELFPALKGRKLEMTGFVWFQGWNDQYGAQDEYASNLRHLINDVRKDLKTPDLPVVVAAMGQNGSSPAEGAMLTVQNAQLSMNGIPEFKNNVRAIRTDVLVDRDAEALYPEWKEKEEEWKKTGGDHPYHYLGSPVWFTRIGHAMGETMLELLSEKK